MRHSDFDGKVIVVTGGTRGIGKAISRQFLESGAVVVALYRSRNEAAGEASAVLQKIGRYLFVQCDITDWRAVEETIARIYDTFGGADVLVNSAGVLKHGSILEMPLEDMKLMFETNLFGVINLTRAVAPLMLQGEPEGKSIVNIASVRAYDHYVVPGGGVYAASKAALKNLTVALAYELRPIRVNSVSPDRTRTTMTADAGRKAEIIGQNDPEDVARAVLFLASSAAKNITGQDYIVGSSKVPTISFSA